MRNSPGTHMFFSGGLRISYIIIVIKVFLDIMFYTQNMIICQIKITCISSTTPDTYQDRLINRPLIDPCFKIMRLCWRKWPYIRLVKISYLNFDISILIYFCYNVILSHNSRNENKQFFLFLITKPQTKLSKSRLTMLKIINQLQLTTQLKENQSQNQKVILTSH